MQYNILICGVGGQGIILLSKVLGQAAFDSGYKVRVGEIHGMSQRGGSVISYVRFGDSVYASMVPQGKGNVMLALEPLEALRYVNYMDKDSYVLMNTEKVTPTLAEIGEYEYPEYERIEESIKEFSKLIKFNAVNLASKAGNKVAANIVMVGALQALESFPIGQEPVKKAIKNQVPQDALNINLKAFDLGRGEIKNKL